MPPWIQNLIFALVGGAITFLASIGIDAIRSRRDEKKVHASILGEIRSNVESAKNGDYSSLLWVDDVYKANLDKLGCFSASRLQSVVRFYAKVAQYKDRITRQYKEHLEQEERNRQQDIKGTSGIFEGTVLMLAKEIETLGNEILDD